MRFDSSPAPVSRRALFRDAGCGFGLLALGDLLGRENLLAASPSPPLAPRISHQPAKAKSVIFLFMYGGPSHVDLFDHKPALSKYAGRKVDEIVDTKGARATGTVFPSPFEFRRHGQSGQWVSDRYPHLARVIDHVAMIKSAYTDSISHAPALFQMNTGQVRTGFPSVGSWITYGLGSANDNLPGFVVMYDHTGGPIGGAPNWGSGFPAGSVPRGLRFARAARPFSTSIALRRSPPRSQRELLDYAAALKRATSAAEPRGKRTSKLASTRSSSLTGCRWLRPKRSTCPTRPSRRVASTASSPVSRASTSGRSASWLAASSSEVFDSFRLYSGGAHGDDNWDAHGSIVNNHGKHCAATDRPMAGLITDLAQRGLLDDTLVVWGGEFGRTPQGQGKGGRDHHPFGMTVWMAGGGIRGGTSYGETDEIGYHSAIDRASVHDIHATMLHLLGIDDKRLTYHFSGRDFRLTDVAGDVIHEIIS